MPTYNSIQREIRETKGYVPKTCWIAHCFEISGKKMLLASNRIDNGAPRHPCPLDKQQAILQVIQRLAATKSVKEAK
jgi:hypothetical protein